MPDPIYTFLNALATWMAAAASPALVYATTPRTLWIGMADEAYVPKDASNRPAPYAVMQAYGGSVQQIGLETTSIQIKCVGYGDSATLNLAQSLYQTLLDGNDRPARNVIFGTSPQWRVLGFLNIRPPSIVSRDEKGRPEVRINFDVQYAETSPILVGGGPSAPIPTITLGGNLTFSGAYGYVRPFRQHDPEPAHRRHAGDDDAARCLPGPERQHHGRRRGDLLGVGGCLCVRG